LKYAFYGVLVVKAAVTPFMPLVALRTSGWVLEIGQGFVASVAYHIIHTTDNAIKAR